MLCSVEYLRRLKYLKQISFPYCVFPEGHSQSQKPTTTVVSPNLGFQVPDMLKVFRSISSGDYLHRHHRRPQMALAVTRTSTKVELQNLSVTVDTGGTFKQDSSEAHFLCEQMAPCEIDLP